MHLPNEDPLYCEKIPNFMKTIKNIAEGKDMGFFVLFWFLFFGIAFFF